MALRPLVLACEKPSLQPLLNWLASTDWDNTDDIFESFSPTLDKLRDKLLDVFSDGELRDMLRELPRNNRKRKRDIKINNNQGNENRSAVDMWKPRRRDNGDNVEWHLPSEDWVRPEDIEMNLDASQRRLELRARREVRGRMPASDARSQRDSEDQDAVEEKAPNASTENGNNTNSRPAHPDKKANTHSEFSSIREMRQCLTIPDEVDLDKLTATLSADRSRFVVSGPLKTKRPLNDQRDSVPVPIKISRK